MRCTAIVTAVLTSAACASAQWNSTAPYAWASGSGSTTATGTAAVASGTGSAYPSSYSPIYNGAPLDRVSGSMLGLVIAGGVAMIL